MKTCKEKLPDGKPCPNQVDNGQKYCFYHLANQDKNAKNVFEIVVTVLGALAVGIGTMANKTNKRT